MEKTTIGKCPVCGGDVVKTQKGWACSNALMQPQSCKFFIYNLIGNRNISDSEAALLLEEKKLLLDGFSTKEGKTFTSIVSFANDGSVDISGRLGVCPKCGGQLYVNNRAVSCSNYHHPESPCKFTIWRNSGGHLFSLKELEEVITLGAISNEVEHFDNTGNRTMRKFGLNDNKDATWL